MLDELNQEESEQDEVDETTKESDSKCCYNYENTMRWH